MANLNKVMLIGRLTRDPEVRTFASGGKVAKFGFAVNNRRKNATTGQWEDEPVFIDVDAPWRKSLAGSYERPFAGYKSHVFATGAAQLARMARCPIISCVYSLENDGTIVLEWGSPIRIACNDADSDVDVMNKLIDTLELAIGERPTQYVLRIGDSRRWNSRSRRWEELTD